MISVYLLLDYRRRRKVPRKLGRRVLSASHYIYKAARGVLSGVLACLTGERSARNSLVGCLCLFLSNPSVCRLAVI